MVSNRNLILFSYDFPPSDGGIARLCQEIAAGMKTHYKSVTVLTRNKQGLHIPYNMDDVQVFELPNKRIICEVHALSYLLKLKNKETYDILCGTWHPEGLLALLAGCRNVFVLAHGTEFLAGNSFFRKKIWLSYYANLVLKRVKLVIANSNYTKGLVLNIAPQAAVSALPLAVNHHFFLPSSDSEKSEDTLRLCTVSRIEQFKGHDFIASVIAQMQTEYRKKIKWHIAGTGSYLAELKQLITQLGIQEQVQFHGFIKDADLPKFYNENDVFVLCSRESPNNTSVEGFGLVFLEAQSCGLPVIGTDTGGISDAIDNGNGGWLIGQDNETELQNLLIHFLEDKAVIRQMGGLARERVLKGCTWDIYCKELFQLMQAPNES